MASPAEPSSQQRDCLEIVVERRLQLQQQHRGGSSSMTIFRVPAHVRVASKELYEPRLVSIGPYYRGREALSAMEEHKWRYLGELLAQHSERATLATCVKAIRDVADQARSCYSEKAVMSDAAVSGGNNIDDDFAEMLLLDGCFIIQFFTNLHNGKKDRLYDVGWGHGLLHSDLLLLENQIPFFVLKKLFDAIAPPESPVVNLFKLILPDLQLRGESTFFFNDPLSYDEVAANPEIHHLLHLFYVAFVPTAMADNNKGMQPPAQSILMVPSVTMLREAGIRFNKKRAPQHMFDVTFDDAKGVMEIPRVQVDQANKPLLVNLIAFEQTTGLRGNALLLSSYTALMSFLVRTGKDVEKLQKWGIMDNLLSNEDDAATSFFHHLGGCSTLDYTKHHFATLFTGLDKYYNSNWHKYKAKFLRDYCSSPWSIIGISVAALVFAFGIFKLSVDTYRLAKPSH